MSSVPRNSCKLSSAANFSVFPSPMPRRVSAVRIKPSDPFEIDALFGSEPSKPQAPSVSRRGPRLVLSLWVCAFSVGCGLLATRDPETARGSALRSALADGRRVHDVLLDDACEPSDGSNSSGGEWSRQTRDGNSSRYCLRRSSRKMTQPNCEKHCGHSQRPTTIYD